MFTSTVALVWVELLTDLPLEATGFCDMSSFHVITNSKCFCTRSFNTVFGPLGAANNGQTRTDTFHRQLFLTWLLRKSYWHWPELCVLVCVCICVCVCVGGWSRLYFAERIGGRFAVVKCDGAGGVVAGWGFRGFFSAVHTHYFSKVKLDRANYKVGLSTWGQYKQQLSVA